jgi:hypothetical protein
VTPIDPSMERSSFGSNDPSERSEGSHRTREPDLVAGAGQPLTAMPAAWAGVAPRSGADSGPLEMSPALRRQRSTMDAALAAPTVAKRPGPGRAANQPAHCGICRSELEGEELHRHDGREERGSYCSPGCLSAADALVALQLWSVKLESSGRRDEAEARTTLADDLLLLWRKHTGPDPEGVCAAVELARSRTEAI